jgi:hypothetical protein
VLALSETLIIKNITLGSNWAEIINERCLNLKFVLIKYSCKRRPYCVLDLTICSCLQRIIVEMNVLDAWSPLQIVGLHFMEAFIVLVSRVNPVTFKRISSIHKGRISLYIDGNTKLKSW